MTENKYWVGWSNILNYLTNQITKARKKIILTCQGHALTR